MHLALSFSVLLTTLLLALAQVEALPTTRSPRTVTLALKRLPQRSDVHPSILLQQHVNRSHRRHARMVGVDGPSDAELEARLVKRFNAAKFPKQEKRYNRNGVNKVQGSSIKGANSLVEVGGTDGSILAASPADGFPKAALDAANAGELTKANKPTANNSIGLDIEANDVGYIATVQVGTPPRDFSILMDSGSADFWIGAEGCQSQQGGDCGNHVFLGKTSSSTFKDSGKPFQVTYGSGHVEGNIIADNVNIAGLALNAHSFGVALWNP